MCPHAARSSSGPTRRFGYSLVELLVAIILIDVGLLAVVQTHAVLVRRRNEMRARAAASGAAASRLERLVGAPCVPAIGSAATRDYRETWLVGVNGSGREIGDSVTFGAGVPRRVVLRTQLPC